jgi:subtilisin family serine protease
MARDSSVQAVGPEHLFELPAVQAQKAASGPVASPQGAPTSDDWGYGYQWDMRRIGADQVWGLLPITPVRPRVALLDNGTMDTHPDLVGQIDASKSTSYCNTSGGANNSAGYPVYSTFIDFHASPDWAPGDACTALGFDDYEFHGTHTAGTIAANFGGGAVVGVAPDALIGVYKVFDAYSLDGASVKVGAFDGPLFAAIIDATLSGYPVISMSLGGNGLRGGQDDNASWLAWNRVASWANRNGALLVASSGNTGFNLNGKLYSAPSDLPTVMSVSAESPAQLTIDEQGLEVVNDELAFYSNYGSPIDISAPGGACGPSYATTGACNFYYAVLSDGIDENGDAAYYQSIGTSMAAPHVAAVAAQVRALHPDWTPGDTRSWLKQTASPLAPRQYFGAGLLDANAAAH